MTFEDGCGSMGKITNWRSRMSKVTRSVIEKSTFDKLAVLIHYEFGDVNEEYADKLYQHLMDEIHIHYHKECLNHYKKLNGEITCQ